jgi:tetratricopeptide (TPR) repeat protein
MSYFKARSNALGVISLLVIGASGCSKETAAAVAEEPRESATVESTRASTVGAEEHTEPILAPWRIELLELAFEAASRLPLDPHIKNRSKLQAEVIAACIELGQLERSESYAAEVMDWRRGVALGELAHQAARRGDIANADRLAAAARTELVSSIAAEEQEWRSQSILAELALTELTLGRNESVLKLEREIEHSERLELVRAKAHILPEDDVDLQIDEYTKLIETKDFEIMRNALNGALELHDRFYEREETRARLEALVDDGSRTMPSTMRLDMLCRVTEQALEHGDRAHAAKRFESAQSVFDGARWIPEDHVPALARLGALRFRVGETSQGLGQLGAALKIFEDERYRVPDVFRGDALRPVAQAYIEVGEPEAALSVFRKLVEEGALNPNSRPRAQDLIRTALALVQLGLRPDEALSSRLHELGQGLGEPW